MANAFRDAFRLPDLKRRVLFVLGALIVFRLGAHIPTPGIDPRAMAALVARGGVLGFLDLFSGGALRSFSVFALGVAPYINASIVMQLLVVVIPAFEKMQKDGGEDGRKKIVQYTRCGTIFFALIQALGLITLLQSEAVFSGGYFEMFIVAVTVTTGSVVVMWLGEVMSDHGVGNGISMLIYAGIVARMPEVIVRTSQRIFVQEISPISILVVLVIMVFVIAGCILLQEGQRRLQVQYAKRMVGNKVYGGQSTFIPLKVNTSGVIPVIFASSFLIIPTVLIGLLPESDAIAPAKIWLTDAFKMTGVPYMFCYALLIVFFSYFYTSVVFNPSDIANNMKKNGGFILGIRPGKPTSDYIERVMNRITLGGACALAIVALIPSIVGRWGVWLGMRGIEGSFLGGTAILIVVGVALDTVHQVEGQLLMRHYDGILKKRNKSGSLLKL